MEGQQIDVDLGALTEFDRASQRHAADFDKIVQKLEQASVGRESFGLMPGSGEIFDGYEQLSPLNRFRLRRLCAESGCGLLVTTHTPQWFVGEILYRTSPSDATIEKIVSYLLDDSQRYPGTEIFRELRRRHKNNIRAILDGLYDWWAASR